MSDQTELTVTSTRNWAWTREYNLQLSEGTRNEHFPDAAHGDFLLLEAEHDGVTFGVFGKVELQDTEHVGAGHVGIGNNLRYALGVDLGEPVRVTDAAPPQNWTRRLDQLLGKRPVLCRVRSAVHPDIGFDVCRVSVATMDALGITPGDHVIVESAGELQSLRALPLRDEVVERKRRETDQRPDRYPDPVDVLDLDRLAGTDIDVPTIYLDAERRDDLALEEQAKTGGSSLTARGVCQPVKVSRNASSVYVRSLNEVTVPVILGLLGTVLVFEPVLTPLGKLAIVALGLLVILLSITYHVRKTTLG